MAVAVKTPPGTRYSGTLASPAILSLVGVLYLLACLVIVFKLLPDLWWSAWDALGWGGITFVGGTLLVMVALAVGVGLLILGGRLLGPHPPAGVRAGVFVAFSGLLIVVLLARWISIQVENAAYSGAFSPQVGAWIVGVIGVLLLAGWIRLFTWPRVQRFVLLLEHGGWFHATSYKWNQGQKVRRGTIFGILLLVGAGIYTLISHDTLQKGSRNWALNIPFTGKVAIESYGNNGGLLPGDTTEFFINDVSPSAKSQVQVRMAGDTSLSVGRIIPAKHYEDAVNTLLQGKGFPADVASVRSALAELADEGATVEYLDKVDELIYNRTKQLLSPQFFPEETLRRLREVDQQTDMADMSKLVEAVKAEAAKMNPAPDIGPVLNLPVAVLVVDRFALHKINQNTEKDTYVKVVLKGDSNLTEGQIVPRSDFDAEVDKLNAEKKKGRDRELPTEQPLVGATGATSYDTVTLLPSIQFTVPLILLVGSIWLAWRIVNMPTFADFLIATEAEMNKVSWTTQKRLVQDTIVVLATVFLMSVFLFGMDWTWKVVLSWQPIGVLHIPKDSSDKDKKIEQKKW
jgi:preprotein translocase SecE subunit